jgi:DNA helicase II / ATP-dependent DNA helicase PcrA
MSEDKYGLNDEQWAAVIAPSPTIVNASAGSGKTRCLTAKIRYLLDAGAQPRNICAITFTNKAANEMKERIKVFCPYVTAMQVSTIHSMAVRIIKVFPQHTPLKIPFSIYDDNDQLAIMKAITKARGITEDPSEILSLISKAKSEDTVDEDFEDIQKVYQDILIKNNACDFDDLLLYARDCLKHDDCKTHYSNLWQHLLVDEFQDTSIVQYEIVTLIHDPQKTKTLFVVGDANQCLVSGSVISTEQGEKLIEDTVIGDKIKSGIGRGKIGHYQISNKYTKEVVNAPVIIIKTEQGYSLTSTYEHLYFAGFGQLPIQKRYYVYLMYRKDRGYRIGFTRTVRGGGGKNPLVHGFKIRTNQEYGEALWIIGSYDNEADARYYEHFYSIKYGIPTWIFHSTYRQLFLKYDDILIEKLYRNIDTETRALELFKDLGLFKAYPHHVPKCNTLHRKRNFTITYCIHRGLHHYAINGASLEDMDVFKKEGLPVRFQKGRKGYRIEGSSKNINEIYKLKDRIKKFIPVNLIEAGRFCDHSLPMTPASHLLPGMECFIYDGKEIKIDIISEVNKSSYTGKIFDIDITQVHNFIANGIITHNSIYGWRSAKPENMENFIDKYKPSVQYLTYNYRSSPEIISHANEYLQFGKPMVAKAPTKGVVAMAYFSSQEEEADKIADALQRVGNYPESVIIYRTNSRSLLFERALAIRKVPYKVVGDIPFYKRRVSKDLLSYCKAAVNHQDMESLIRSVNTPKRGFGAAKQEKLLNEGWDYLHGMADSMPSIQSFVKILDEIKHKRPLQAIEDVLFATGYRDTLETDSDRQMLATFLNVSAGFNTIDELILTSNFLEEDSGHGVRLMSAHASKGLEFDRVFVVGVEEGIWPHALAEDVDEERRLYYVACTRAKKYLNISYSKTKLYRNTVIPMSPSPLFEESLKNLAKNRV